MGGLVARLALLSNPLPFVRLLFLLGTPNAGAIRLSQLAILSQMMHAGFGGLFAVFPRASGIYELSRASRILEKYSANAANTSDVDYISIPGLLFHEDQALFEDVRSSGSKFFASLDAATRIMSALHPLLALQLGRPHDGIVEESSNNMITGPSGRWHEKKGSIGNQRGNHAATYAHAVLPACGKLNHIEIHSDLNVIDVIGRLILSSYATNQSNGMRPAPADADKSLPAGRLGEWVRSFTQKDRDTIDVSFGR
jgi:hypothetical protein